jgi:hypothetical protein
MGGGWGWDVNDGRGRDLGRGKSRGWGRGKDRGVGDGWEMPRTEADGGPARPAEACARSARHRGVTFVAAEA